MVTLLFNCYLLLVLKFGWHILHCKTWKEWCWRHKKAYLWSAVCFGIYFFPWNVPWWRYFLIVIKFLFQSLDYIFYIVKHKRKDVEGIYGGSNKRWKLFLNFVTMGHVTMGQNNPISFESITTLSWYFLPCFWVKNSFQGGSNKWWKIFLNFVTVGHVTMGQINLIS